MTTHTHTAGPWIAVSDNKPDETITIYGNDNQGMEIPNTIVTRLFHADRWGSEKKEETQANARLIAACPDLLAALETIAQWEFDIMGDCVTDARRLARAAINKAKGS